MNPKYLVGSGTKSLMKLKKINFRKFCPCGSDAGTTAGARSLRTRIQYTTAALILTGTFYSASAMAQVSWTGGASDGLWGTAGNWSTNLVPSGTSIVLNTTTNLITVNNGGSFGTFVDDGELDLTGGTFSGGLVNSTLQVNNILALNGGTLANVEVLAPTNSSSVVINNNGGNNISNVVFDAGTNIDMASQLNAYTEVRGSTTFNGTTSMAAGSNINIWAGGGSTTLTNNGTIQGAGTISQSYSGYLTNTGTIDANLTGQTLVEQVNSFTNTGNLNASNGGTLTIQNAGVVGGDVNATTGSTVNLPNGIVQTTGTSTIDGSLNSSAGNFTLGGGTLKGTGDINMSVTQTGGTFNPGSDPANMNITGNLSISSGTYQLDLASLSTFDTLNVSGTTNISGGKLYLDFLGGYHPLLNNSYQFLLSSFTPGQSGFSSITSDLTGYGFTYNNGIVTVGSVPPPAVPEASSVLSLMTMLGIGGAGFASNRRKSRRKADNAN